MRTIARSVFAVALVAVSLVTAAPALAGGGGCAELTHGSGSVVRIEDACFTPSIISIPAGDSVTFVNEDPFAHNVIGSSWGHPDDLNQDEAFTATFAEPGIYPWACWYHPGMTGAIVVGDGTGVGNGAAVDVSSFSQPEPSPVAEVRTVTQASSAPAVAGWVIGPLLGIGIGLWIAALIRRRRPAA